MFNRKLIGLIGICLFSWACAGTMGVNTSKGIYVSLEEKKPSCPKSSKNCPPQVDKVSETDIPTAPQGAQEPDPGKVLMPLKRGSVAPFSGTLASPAAVADIIAQLKSIDERMRVESEHARKNQEIKDNYVIENLKAEKERLEKQKELMVNSRDEQIKILTQELSKAKDPNSQLWFGLGLFGGVVLTTAVAVVIGNSVSK